MRNIISLHSTSATDVGNFMGRIIENGNMEKGQEMIDWQRYKMRTSLQIRLVKGLIMDLAPLLHHEGNGGGRWWGVGCTTTTGDFARHLWGVEDVQRS